jgi:hypothetical protein
LQRDRDVEHERQVAQRRLLDLLAADRPFMSDEGRHRYPFEVRSELGPRVVHRDHLRQRTDREAPRFAVQHGGGPFGRGEQRQAVLGERGRRPQLATGLASRRRAAVTQPQQARPIASRAAGVDEPHQSVEVDRLDQPIEGVVITFAAHAAHTSGHG